MAKIFFFLGIWLASSISIAPCKSANQLKTVKEPLHVRLHNENTNNATNLATITKLPELDTINNSYDK